MSRDRIAYLTTSHPAETELGDAARRYLGNIGVVEPQDGFFTCSLPGIPTRMFVPRDDLSPDSRWFEVWRVNVDDGTFINVVTRNADEFTNAVADGYFRAIARRWNLVPEHDAPKLED